MSQTENRKRRGVRFDDYAVSEQVGYVILIGIIVTGLSIAVLFSMPSVNSSKDNAQFTNIEQAFTTADSRISKARFSTSIFQEISFQLNEGAVIVNNSSADSYIEILKYDRATNTNYTIYQAPLGTIKCVTDFGEVAYQDGGVWEKYPDGGSIMISPPDFDFNGETLTLPLMRIAGNSSMATSAGGKILVDVKSNDPVTVYPRNNGMSTTLANPVEEGKDIIVKVKSDYYQAWADFINERTLATATVDPADRTVTVLLMTGAPTQSGLVKNGLNTKHMETDNNYAPVIKFSMHLEKRNPGKDYFISLRPPAGTDPFLNVMVCRLKGPGKENVGVIYEYTDSANNIHEAFSTTLEFDSSTEYHDIDINMMSDTILMMYGDSDGDGDIDDNGAWAIDPDSTTWGADPLVTGDTGSFPGLYDANDVHYGDFKKLCDVTEHYLRLMATKHPGTGPTYVCHGTERGNDNNHIHFDSQTSTFLFKFESRQDLKYLYVTEGTLDLSIGATG
ncbi:MAG: hypothetical protein A4E28_01757 [Methanocella sp. PtaU1.Bin125]|nr:MAG: hypothetical protein A4E28_01757 [Methanocella sp. PtaU1.Bin125]